LSSQNAFAPKKGEKKNQGHEIIGRTKCVIQLSSTQPNIYKNINEKLVAHRGQPLDCDQEQLVEKLLFQSFCSDSLYMPP